MEHNTEENTDGSSIVSTKSTPKCCNPPLTSPTVTRTIKNNDRNHAGLADGTALPEDRLPRYFAKTGHVDADPKGVKKQGGGKGNW